MPASPADLAKVGLSLGTGLVQKIQANKLKREADSAMPAPIDPNQAGFLSELNQKRASLDAGTAYAAGLNNINAAKAGTDNALVQAGGGNTSGTIQSLLQSERTSGDSLNNLNAQGQQQQNFQQSAYGDLLNKIAGRRMQLELLNSQQKRGEWAEKAQSANMNFMAGAAGIPSLLGGGAGGNATQTPAQQEGATKPVGADDATTEAPDGPANTGEGMQMPGMLKNLGSGEAMGGLEGAVTALV